jgi:hypothetical protein
MRLLLLSLSPILLWILLFALLVSVGAHAADLDGAGDFQSVVPSEGPADLAITGALPPGTTIQERRTRERTTRDTHERVISRAPVPVTVPVPAPPAVVVPPPPACRPGVVAGLGLDAWGRPIGLNLRSGPDESFPPVLIAFAGQPVTVCGAYNNWLQTEVCTPFGCVRGYAYRTYVFPGGLIPF